MYLICYILLLLVKKCNCVAIMDNELQLCVRKCKYCVIMSYIYIAIIGRKKCKDVVLSQKETDTLNHNNSRCICRATPDTF